MNLRDIFEGYVPSKPSGLRSDLEELSTATDCNLGVGVGTVCNTGSALPLIRCS
jgi:hypothetical protein